MKPETSMKWEDALSRFRNAEELWKGGKYKEAAVEADIAVWLACAAMMTLSDELKIPYLSQRAKHYATTWSNRMKEKGYDEPKETFEQASIALQRLSDELPANTFPTLR